jgi:hypothetical protein
VRTQRLLRQISRKPRRTRAGFVVINFENYLHRTRRGSCSSTASFPRCHAELHEFSCLNVSIASDTHLGRIHAAREQIVLSSRGALAGGARVNTSLFSFLTVFNLRATLGAKGSVAFAPECLV